MFSPFISEEEDACRPLVLIPTLSPWDSQLFIRIYFIFSIVGIVGAFSLQP